MGQNKYLYSGGDLIATAGLFIIATTTAWDPSWWIITAPFWADALVELCGLPIGIYRLHLQAKKARYLDA